MNRMKKVIYTSIFLLLLVANVFGQNTKTKKADTYFNDLSYIKAADAYENLLEKDSTSYVLQRLGDCYYLNSNMEKASKWFEILFNRNDKETIESEYFFKYAQALRGIGNYKESDQWMKQFHQKQKEDRRGVSFSEKENELPDLTPVNPSFTIKNVEALNTANSEYGIAYFDGKIIYAATREQGNFVKRKHTWNNKGFLDLFSAKEEDGAISEKQPIKELNTIYHESSVAFSPDKKTIYFTRNNYNSKKLGKDKSGFTNLKIYSAQLIDGKWKNIQELPFNRDDYSVGHPAVSSDGKKLFFVSDMSGSFGQTDIFYVEIKGDNSFGPIQTLGIHVNTEGKEMFPYVIDNKLYFSSDGHFGLGGLDVFVTEEKDGDFLPPRNLKAPINSKSDDFAFVLNSTNNSGYFSSNREGGIGSDDIYSFTYSKPIVKKVEEKPCKQEVSGIVVDKKFGVPLKDAKIVVTQQDGTVVSELITGISGKFSYFLPCNKTYKITASKEYYQPDSNTFRTTEAMALELDLDFDLEVISDFTYNDRHELMIRIDPIFFDYNKVNINADAAQELNRIVEIMNRHPKLIVESTSHTDARGRSSYNESLSDRRAKSTVRYIVSKGISPDRITGKGYGESKLTNGCVDNDTHTNRVKCSEEEHQTNRRSEFLIKNIFELGIALKVAVEVEEIENENKKKKLQNSHTVKPGDTLFSIAKHYGISVDQIKKINGLTNNNIAVGLVLKLE